jgi:hypothetical protein
MPTAARKGASTRSRHRTPGRCQTRPDRAGSGRPRSGRAYADRCCGGSTPGAARGGAEPGLRPRDSRTRPKPAAAARRGHPISRSGQGVTQSRKSILPGFDMLHDADEGAIRRPRRTSGLAGLIPREPRECAFQCLFSGVGACVQPLTQCKLLAELDGAFQMPFVMGADRILVR